jgi:hypothetical protein
VIGFWRTFTTGIQDIIEEIGSKSGQPFPYRIE